MSNNQTIDGVPRELLEQFLAGGRQCDRERLRAQLDAPAKDYVLINGMHFSHAEILEWREKACADMEKSAHPQGEPVACSHEWTDDGEFTLTCTKCGKTENHEPYGWVQTRGNAINHFTQEWDVVESWEDQGFEYKAMYDHAEQPAPGADENTSIVPALVRNLEAVIELFTLLDRDCNRTLVDARACLDKVKELNPQR